MTPLPEPPPESGAARPEAAAMGEPPDPIPAGRLALEAILAAPLYLLAFAAMTWPLMLSFRTHIFGDAGDGFTNFWNIWWIDKALTELGRNPYHTFHLYHPGGTTLLGHTLNPFNGLMAIPLLRFASLTAAHNFCLVFGFAASGAGAFALARDCGAKPAGAFAGGYIFAFCSYRFAHAQGHMNLASTEWLPVFLLCFRRLLRRPGPGAPLAAAAAMALNLLCDYYYLLYCFLAGLFLVLWEAAAARDPLWPVRRGRLPSLALFSAAAGALCGPVAAKLLLVSRNDPFIGAHPISWYSLDALAPFIYGGHWRFGELTRAYWEALPAERHEASVHIGWAALGMAFWAWRRSRRPGSGETSLTPWAAMAIVFYILAMGRSLNIWGRAVPWIPLPYAALEVALPPLKLSGVPMRMIVLTQLAVAVMAARGLDALLAGGGRGRRAAAAVWFAAVLAESLATPIPLTRLPVPGYVRFLRDHPEHGAVIDTLAIGGIALFNQTVHERPMSFGYIARVTGSVHGGTVALHEAINAALDRGEIEPLAAKWGFRFLAVTEDTAMPGGAANWTPVYRDGEAKVFDLKAAAVRTDAAPPGGVTVPRVP